LSMFFSPGERMPISPMNLCWLADPHDLHRMLAAEEKSLVIIYLMMNVRSI
jgi:hypothetical protein